jgi:hypothetical protein
VAPREILRLPVPTITEGEPANLTMFDADTEWTFEERHIRSKSRNTPFVGRPYGRPRVGRLQPRPLRGGRRVTPLAPAGLVEDAGTNGRRRRAAAGAPVS